MGNRVLSPDEVLALPDGARVWVDANPTNYGEEAPGVHLVHLTTDNEDYELKLVEEGASGPQYFWPIERFDDTDYGCDFRAWSLPQPPTAGEMAAHPWKPVP